MGDVITELIRQCVSDLGATAMSITHDMASVRRIADRVAMIYEGRILWTGPADDLGRSGNDYVDQFVHGRAEGPIKMPVRPLRHPRAAPPLAGAPSAWQKPSPTTPDSP